MIIWLKTKLDIEKSIFDPSKLVLSLVYQDFDFVLKSPATTIMKGFFQPYGQSLILRLLKTFQNHPFQNIT